MRKLFLFFLFTFTFSHAQDLIDDNDVTENRKEVGSQNVSFNVHHPLESYRLKCDNPVYALFPEGETTFKDTLYKNISGYIDGNSYSVNGTFEVIFFLSKDGNMERFQLKPDVPNSNLLYRDVESALKKMNPKWIPASCSGIPIESRLRQKISFRTETYDI